MGSDKDRREVDRGYSRKQSKGPPGKGEKPGSGRRPKGFPIFVLALAALVMLLVIFALGDLNSNVEEITVSELRAKLAKNEIKSLKARISAEESVVQLEGEYVSVESGTPASFSTKISRGGWEQLTKGEGPEGSENLLVGVEYSVEKVDDTLGWFVRSIVPFIIIVAIIWFLFFRRAGGPFGGGVMSFGKSRAKMYSKENISITFDDMAGAEEAKEEVAEIVEFLKNPQRFARLGAKIPKGVLMIGPPGCGKTLLAKAIAGEAECPFFSISGSDFVEMFVGVGASRVRDLFRNARENSPCIVFIDEIDAVGRRRGSGIGGGHDEREQTLNAILVEMDGMGSNEGVIMLAATNRPDVLDTALLRPGRFDRSVYIDLPDVKGREEIFLVHLKNIKAGSDIDASELARLTPGFSGADIMNLVNEAALLAVIRYLDVVTRDCMLEARDRVRFGRQKKSRAMDEEESKLTAYHEAGHALVQELTEHTDRVHKVTIIPRGQALGSTMSLPDKDRHSLAQKRAEQLLMVALAGRASEEEFLGEVSAGAASDIQMATEIARRMVTEWGMSPRLGLVNYAPDEEQAFGQGTIGRPHNYSDETALAIDEEVRRLVDTGFNLALEMLKANREKLEAIAQALIKYETLDHEDLVTLIEGGDLDAKRRKDADDRKREVAAQKHRQMEEAKAERAETGETGFVGPGASRPSGQPDPA